MSEVVSAVRDLALGIVDSLGSLWMDRGANIRDLNGRDLNDHFALLGRACQKYNANQNFLDAGLRCFARISRQPVATIYASGLSTTEYVLRLCLMFVSSFERIVGVRLQRDEDLTEEDKATLRKAWPVVREPFDNSGVLPTYGQCIQLKAEIQWESQRAMDTEASKSVEGAHRAARPPSPDPLPSRPTSAEASIATEANTSLESECMSDQNPDLLPDYPHQFPLVGERDIVKAKQAAEGRNLDLQQTALVNLGFPWDFWLPIELARKWRSSVFPRIATREAVDQWRQFVQEQIGCATIAQSNRSDSSWPVVGNKIADALESDLTLMERHASHLVAFVMSDPISAVRQAIRALINVEWDNFRAGIHRPGSRRAEVLRQRDERLTELRRLMAKALPVGINAGFTGETVEGRLNELALATQALTQWDRTLERSHPSGVAYLDETPIEWQQTNSLDDQAEAHLVQLCESVESKLSAVENLAVAAVQTPPESAPDPLKTAIEVFYSYSHKDEKQRERLEKHLAMLKRQGVIAEWHDRKIGAGTEWKGHIDEHLNSARVILLLVSADFLHSDYCYDVEMARAMQRHKAGEARVIPIILKPCDWQHPPLNDLQALPKDAKPVTKWKDRDEAFADVARGIRAATVELSARKG